MRTSSRPAEIDSGLGYQRTAAGSPRQLFFFLSPRLIDVDTYVPVALALREQRPNWPIRFIAFRHSAAEAIAANTTLASALAACGEFIDLEGSESSSRLAKFLRATRPMLSGPPPVLLHGRQFSEFPFALWYLLARARGGSGFVMARSRNLDGGIHEHILPRLTAHRGRPSLLERLARRDNDGIVHYHDQQQIYLASLGRFGRVEGVTQTSIGLPQLLPAWQRFVQDWTEKERAALANSGLPTSEVYAMLAPKPHSSANLAAPDSAERAFRLTLLTLRNLRPNALILIRPHPVAPNPGFLADAIKAVGDRLIVKTLMHPDVMHAIARATFVNAPTNVVFTSTSGLFIDCTDYRPSHYERKGERSMADGYGTLFINPRAPDFESRLAAALNDDIDLGVLAAERDRFIARNAPNIERLVRWIEQVPGHA